MRNEAFERAKQIREIFYIPEGSRHDQIDVFDRLSRIYNSALHLAHPELARENDWINAK